jgi:hypothetical protein
MPQGRPQRLAAEVPMTALLARNEWIPFSSSLRFAAISLYYKLLCSRYYVAEGEDDDNNNNNKQTGGRRRTGGARQRRRLLPVWFRPPAHHALVPACC